MVTWLIDIFERNQNAFENRWPELPFTFNVDYYIISASGTTSDKRCIGWRFYLNWLNFTFILCFMNCMYLRHFVETDYFNSLCFTRMSNKSIKNWIPIFVYCRCTHSSSYIVFYIYFGVQCFRHCFYQHG